MSQMLPGDWPINPNDTDGATLAEKLNRLSAAQLSGMAGATRPAGLTAGGVWIRNAANGSFEAMLFDGAADRRIFTLSPGGSAPPVFDGVYSRAETDAALADLAAQIAALSGVPRGFIFIWSGSVAAIPAGYALCNGQNGTPDLRDRFVMGAGGAFAVNAKGGRSAITEVPTHDHGPGSLAAGAAGGHNHAITDPGHTHTVTDGIATQSGDANLETGRRATVLPATTTRTTANRQTGISLAAAPNHTHPLTGRAASEGQSSVDVLNPYFALAYVMKL
jgi:hypothetical protein